MLPPPEKFSGGFSNRDIKRFSSPDLPDPHHHAPPLTTTVVTSIPPPSSTPSPSSSHHSPHPPPHHNRHQHQYHLHHHGCHAANTIITTHARHAPPPPCSHLEERNIQLAATGSPSTQLDEDTRKSQLLPEGKKSDPKDSVGNKQPIDTGLPSTVSDEGTVKTTLLLEGPHGDKDSEGLKPPTDMEPLTNHVANPSGTDAEYQVDQTQSARLRYQSLTKNEGKTSSEVDPDSETLRLKTFAEALLLSDDEMVQESDDEEVFEDGENIDKDTLADEEEHQSPPPNKEQLESSHAQESDSDSSCPDALRKYDNILPLTEKQLWAQHEEAAVSYVFLKASIEGYYEENVDHRDQTDKLVQATMDCVDKNSTERADPLKALNGVTETLKVVQEAVKDDLALNRKVIESTEAYTKNSTSLYEMLTLIKNFDFQGLKSSVEYLQATAISQDQHLAAWAKSSTSMAWNLSNRLTAIESSVPATLAITAAPASIEGENVANTADEE
ncbi:hypothetical protein Tco_1391535 [Tanacetum coccineum]